MVSSSIDQEKSYRKGLIFVPTEPVILDFTLMEVNKIDFETNAILF